MSTRSPAIWLASLLLGLGILLAADSAWAACDCATPPCTGTTLSQRSPAMRDFSSNTVSPSSSWCEGCDAGGVSTLTVNFTCGGGACTCGRYITGDYWIVDPNPGSASEGVAISDITPRASGGRNGMDINPVGEAGPFDSRANSWQYNASENKAVPLTAHAGQSLVKAVSLQPSRGDCTLGSMGGSNGICVHSYFVVTVVGSAPPADAYRPPYYGPTKPTTVWRDSQINWNVIPSFNVPSGGPSIADAYDRIRAPQVDHWGAPGGYLQQQLGLLNTGGSGTVYGADVAVARSESLCRALGPEPVAQGTPSRRDIVRGFVQQGIDAYGIMKTVGFNSGIRWAVAGGHGAGRKAGLAIAAALLADPDLKKMVADAVADEIASGDHWFNEDGIAYRSARNGRALFGEVCPVHAPGTAASNARGWWQPGDKQDMCRDPDGLIDGGNHTQTAPPPYAYNFTTCAVGAGIFGALVPQVRAAWQHDPFFELADRWFGHVPIPGDTGAPGGVWMDDNCTDATPASFSPYSGCTAGTGRRCGGTVCESFHGAGGRGSWQYSSGFCEGIWSQFRRCADTPSAAGCTGYVGLFCGDRTCSTGESTSCPADCTGAPPDTSPPSPPTLLP
jgi:hypothetical protein